MYILYIIKNKEPNRKTEPGNRTGLKTNRRNTNRTGPNLPNHRTTSGGDTSSTVIEWVVSCHFNYQSTTGGSGVEARVAGNSYTLNLSCNFEEQVDKHTHNACVGHTDKD